MSFHNDCPICSYLTRLLRELADGGTIEDTHAELERLLANITWLSVCETCPAARARWMALYDHGRGQTAAILECWEKELM